MESKQFKAVNNIFGESAANEKEEEALEHEVMVRIMMQMNTTVERISVKQLRGHSKETHRKVNQKNC